MYKKLNKTHHKETEESKIQELIKRKKQKLAYDLRTSFKSHTKHLNVGIFHEDALIVDVITLMKSVNADIIDIRNNRDDTIFNDEDYLKYRTINNDPYVSIYTEYERKTAKIINGLINIYGHHNELEERIRKHTSRTIQRLIEGYHRIKNMSPGRKVYYYLQDHSFVGAYPDHECPDHDCYNDPHKRIKENIQGQIEAFYVIPFYDTYSLGSYGPRKYSNGHYLTPYLEFSPTEIKREFILMMNNINITINYKSSR